jgi:hypothetical protein
LADDAAGDSAFEHRSHGRDDESFLVGFVGRALPAGEDGVALADRHERARESLDCLFDRGPLQPGVVQAAGELVEYVRTQGLQQRSRFG